MAHLNHSTIPAIAQIPLDFGIVNQTRSILRWPGCSAVSLRCPAPLSVRPLHPFRGVRRHAAHPALARRRRVRRASPAATLPLLLRCGPARTSMFGRSIGSTRFCISSKTHPISPSRTSSVAAASLRIPASLADRPRHSCLGVRKHVAHPCSNFIHVLALLAANVDEFANYSSPHPHAPLLLLTSPPFNDEERVHEQPQPESKNSHVCAHVVLGRIYDDITQAF
jgi:hypothetical protein